MSKTTTASMDLREAFAFVRSRTEFKPKIALILGSGLGNFAESVTETAHVDATAIPHYPTSSGQGHRGRLIFGHVSNDGRTSPPLLVFQGRVHFYESGDLETVVFPIRLAKQLGVQKLIVTNAAGGVNRQFQAGDLMVIRDVLSLTFEMPRIDANVRRKHTPNVFDNRLQQTIRSSAVSLGIRLREGTYCWLKGPSYETVSEIRMLSRLGVDAVGMSTVPEILVANSLGMKVAGISLISNLAAGLSPTKLSHAEVTETAARVQKDFTNLVRSVVARL